VFVLNKHLGIIKIGTKNIKKVWKLQNQHV